MRERNPGYFLLHKSSTIKSLDAAGVDVTAVRYDGLIHDFGLLNALSEVPGNGCASMKDGEILRRSAHASIPRANATQNAVDRKPR
jgi:acetyl esterase/lipase